MDRLQNHEITNEGAENKMAVLGLYCAYVNMEQKDGVNAFIQNQQDNPATDPGFEYYGC